VLDMPMTDERFARVMKLWLPYTVRIPAVAPPSFIKVAVYDYDGNLAGSTVVQVRQVDS
jgi:hypothetical protein